MTDQAAAADQIGSAENIDTSIQTTGERFDSSEPASHDKAPVHIAVAKDAAFNFIYAQTIAALEDAGAAITYFSPLADQALPEDISGLYLPGGYPELYGRQLAENETMRASIRNAVTDR